MHYAMSKIFIVVFAVKAAENQEGFLVRNVRISENDKEKIKDFLETQSLNYIFGTDFSEMASLIAFDKDVSRPYCATYSGSLASSCLHPVDEKVCT